MRTPVVIFGIGTFASVVAGYLGDDVLAFTVDAEYQRGVRHLDGKPVVPFEEVHLTYPPGEFDLLIAVTQQNGHRDLLKRKYEQSVDLGYTCASYIHPSAYTASLEWNEGILISPMAIVEAHSTLGTCTIIRTGAYVGHHCQIGDFTYIAPRASMSGHVTIGENVFVGNNATLRDRITIGKNAIIGAGAVVLRDVKESEVYKAMEARLLSVDAREVKI